VHLKRAAQQIFPQLAEGRGWRQALQLLDMVGIPRPAERMQQYPHELSGGLAQRVVIALALARRPRLLVADEPTTALDVSVQAQILDLISRLRGELGLSMLIVSHDLYVIEERTDRIAVMYAGRIVENGATPIVLSRPSHPYTMGLLSATPRRNFSERVRLEALDGRPPLLYAPPPGCAFAERCFTSTAKCSATDASLSEYEGRLVACHNVEVAAGRKQSDEPFRPFHVRASGGATPIVSAVKVGKNFSTNPAVPPALREVDLKVMPGEAVGIIGESGSGKTTLARILMGLETPTAGAVHFGGRPLTSLRGEDRMDWRRQVQFVFQDSTSALDPRMTIGASIMQSARLVERDRKRAADMVARALNEVALDESIAQRRPHELSGGQRQRVGFARALVVDPKLIIADEPVSALDVSVQAVILNLIGTLRERRGIAVLMVSHDLGVVSYVCDRVVVMRHGSIVEEGPTDVILARPTAAYTRMLLDAIPGATAPRPRQPDLPAIHP
jgi:oligopeptide/dipeptide ABC transporter ATP-binding protein